MIEGGALSATADTAIGLVGLELGGGWKIEAPVERNRPGRSGGHFSQCYLVVHESGVHGFLKALDYAKALEEADPAAALQPMIAAFLIERDLLFRCRDRGLSKIVRPLADGTFRPPGTGIAVQYLIFEKADGDAREQLLGLRNLDHAWAMRTVHQMAVGLAQLHAERIAHQDLKPSNVLHFNGGLCKLGDMGRASAQTVDAPHDRYRCAGDQGYGPLELLYGSVDPDWNRRRVACDLYLLGSLVISFYLGTSMTAAVQSRMHPSHRWQQWGDGYDAVLPYVRDAFGKVIDDLADNLPGDFRRDATTAVRQLCDPDPLHRGHPRNHVEGRSHYSLERYVSLFNLVATRAELALRR